MVVVALKDTATSSPAAMSIATLLSERPGMPSADFHSSSASTENANSLPSGETTVEKVTVASGSSMSPGSVNVKLGMVPVSEKSASALSPATMSAIMSAAIRPTIAMRCEALSFRPMNSSAFLVSDERDRSMTPMTVSPGATATVTASSPPAAALSASATASGASSALTSLSVLDRMKT